MHDLHCHILPGIDDGPSNWDESLALAECLVQQGVTCVAATPHSYGYAQPYNPQLIRQRTQELRSLLRERRIPLELVSGTEITLSEQMVERLEQGRLLAYGETRTVLLEGLAFTEIEELEQGIDTLIRGGYRVVLAHPEHLRAVQRDPNVLIPLVERGMAAQLTAASLAGSRDRATQALCEDLLLHGLAHLIAGDGHAADGPRAPMMDAGYRAAVALLGDQYARHLVVTIPRLLLSGGAMPAFRPRPIRERRQ